MNRGEKMFFLSILLAFNLFFFTNTFAGCPQTVRPDVLYYSTIDFPGEVEKFRLRVEPDFRYYLIVWGPAQYGETSGIFDPKAVAYYNSTGGQFWERSNTDAAYWMGLGFGSFLELVGVPEGGPNDRVIFVSAPQTVDIHIMRQDEGSKTGFYLFKIIKQQVTGDAPNKYYGSLDDWAALDTSYPGTRSAQTISMVCSDEAGDVPDTINDFQDHPDTVPPEQGCTTDVSYNPLNPFQPASQAPQCTTGMSPPQDSQYCSYSISILGQKEVNASKFTPIGIIYEFKLNVSQAGSYNSVDCDKDYEQYIALQINRMDLESAYYLDGNQQYKKIGIDDLNKWKVGPVHPASLFKFVDYFISQDIDDICLYYCIDDIMNDKVDCNEADIKSACIHFR